MLRVLEIVHQCANYCGTGGPLSTSLDPLATILIGAGHLGIVSFALHYKGVFYLEYLVGVYRSGIFIYIVVLFVNFQRLEFYITS